MRSNLCDKCHIHPKEYIHNTGNGHIWICENCARELEHKADDFDQDIDDLDIYFEEIEDEEK